MGVVVVMSVVVVIIIEITATTSSLFTRVESYATIILALATAGESLVPTQETMTRRLLRRIVQEQSQQQHAILERILISWASPATTI